MFVKICGITRAEDLEAVVRSGADAAGFIAWPKSKRYISPEKLKTLLNAIPCPAGIRKVAVFVDADMESVQRYLDAGINTIQLHGEESPDFAAEISKLAEVWKAIGLKDNSDLDVLRRFTAASKLLADCFDPVLKGGTGRTCNLTLAKEAKASLSKPFLLAGGLTIENLTSIVNAVKPDGIDVSSGVEISPGIKDPAKIHEFVKLAKTL